MTKYTLWKIKSGKRQVWIDWCKELEEKHREEAVETLIEEDLIRERCIIFGEGDESFLFYEHQSIEGREKKPFNPGRELNQKHNDKFHECLEPIKGKVGISGYDIRTQ